MANLTTYERNYCAEHNISLNDYKELFTEEEKLLIISDGKLKEMELKNKRLQMAEDERLRKEHDKQLKQHGKEKRKREQEQRRIEREEKKEQLKKEREERKREREERRKEMEQEKALMKIAKAELKEEEKKMKEQEKIEAKRAKREEMINSYDEWAKGFDFDDKGKIKHTTPNYIYLFENHPEFKGKLSYDKYTDKFIYNHRSKEVIFNDDFYRETQVEIEKFIEEYKPMRTIDSLKTVAKKKSFNSATDLLDALKWDGKPRVETLFIDQLGVEDTDLNREITRRWIIGAVQRLYEPGCQNDAMLILTGGQGCGKSSTLKWLAGPFGFDESISIGSSEQDYGMKLHNCWICCFDEYSALNKKEAGEYKNWLSKQIDSYRPPYGRSVEDHARHNAYCATTNDDTFLKDHTDIQERRMWVLKCELSQKEGYVMHDTRTDKLWRQVMAEAVHMYKSDNSFIPYLPTEMLDKLSQEQLKYKDFNSDNIGEQLIEILDRPYWIKKDGHIESVDDLLQQISKGYKYRSCLPGEEVGHLNFITQAAIKRIMKDILGISKKHDYLRMALSGTWCCVKQAAVMGGKVGKYYVRGVWTDDKMMAYKKTIKKYEPEYIVKIEETETDQLEMLGL